MHPLPYPVDPQSLLYCFSSRPSHRRRHTAPRLSTRGPFTNAHDYRGFVVESARIASFLREPGNSRVSDETMCHGSLISHGKVRPGERYAREPSRAQNFAFGLTIMRHVSGKFINAPAGTTRNYEWTVENNRPRRTKRSMRTVDPGFPQLNSRA